MKTKTEIVQHYAKELNVDFDKLCEMVRDIDQLYYDIHMATEEIEIGGCKVRPTFWCARNP